MMQIDKIIDEIDQNLEDIARFILSKKIENEENFLFKLMQKKFFINLDSPLEHHPKWHQWGIITHTRKFIKFYDTKVQKDLKEWNIYNRVQKHLSYKIDGISKAKLIYIGILFHDIGKFHKNYKMNPNLKIDINFKNHEIYSYNIIKNELFSLLSKNYGLSDNQIEYIAMCARYHFELGIVREFAKKSPQGYTIEFAKSDKFKKNIEKIIPNFKEYAIEVGLLFLADSYAKSDIEYLNRDDKDILKELKIRKLNSNLIHSIKQIPINIEIAREYFSLFYSILKE